MKKKYLEVGKISGTHGVRGMVRIQPWCDDGFLQKFKTFYLDTNGAECLICEKIQPNGNVYIAAFTGIDTIENAEKYRNRILYINRDDAHLSRGEYFIQDLMGCRVYNTDDKKILGVISDVSKTGANDVWHITDADREYLIPVIPDVVNKVDIDNEEIFITPLKGIFDDED